MSNKINEGDIICIMDATSMGTIKYIMQVGTIVGDEIMPVMGSIIVWNKASRSWEQYFPTSKYIMFKRSANDIRIAEGGWEEAYLKFKLV